MEKNGDLSSTKLFFEDENTCEENAVQMCRHRHRSSEGEFSEIEMKENLSLRIRSTKSSSIV